VEVPSGVPQDTVPAKATAISDRRRATRHACLARVRTASRRGVTTDISSDGVAFHTLDRFVPAELVELSVNFELSRGAASTIIHTATVVWTMAADRGRAWHVGVKFLN
jgi:hypothetical protein